MESSSQTLIGDSAHSIHEHALLCQVEVPSQVHLLMRPFFVYLLSNIFPHVHGLLTEAQWNTYLRNVTKTYLILFLISGAPYET